MKKILIAFMMIVSLVVGAVGWSLLTKPTTIIINNPKEVATESQKIIPSSVPATNLPKPTIKTETKEEPENLVYTNPSVVIDAIETAIPQKSYADLLPLMMPNISLIKYATSCCGLITNSQAISELSYLNNAKGPWDFSETNPIAAKLETEDPEHFEGMWIGTSSDFQAVGFKWNDEFLIEKISMVSDYRLITGQ